MASLAILLLAVDSPELWGAVATVIVAIGAGITGGGKFLAAHFERRETASDAFVAAVVSDTKASRAEFREELHKRDVALDAQRIDFLAHLEASREAFTRTIAEHDERYMHSMRESELTCAQRATEDRKLIERIIQIDSGHWKIGDKDRRQGPPRPPHPHHPKGGPPS